MAGSGGVSGGGRRRASGGGCRAEGFSAAAVSGAGSGAAASGGRRGVSGGRAAELAYEDAAAERFPDSPICNARDCGEPDCPQCSYDWRQPRLELGEAALGGVSGRRRASGGGGRAGDFSAAATRWEGSARAPDEEVLRGGLAGAASGAWGGGGGAAGGAPAGAALGGRGGAGARGPGSWGGAWVGVALGGTGSGGGAMAEVASAAHLPAVEPPCPWAQAEAALAACAVPPWARPGGRPWETPDPQPPGGSGHAPEEEEPR